ncbi:MAG: AraC family transcriptional regulator [Candidatus Pristimantibacillus sp.]
MSWLESLQRALDYIEEHLLDAIGIEDIAKQANVSVFHFQRSFTMLTEVAVGEYVRRRRLTLAAQEIARTNSKIIDLAYKYGYDTPEAFTKAFRRQHGISPTEARKQGGKLTVYNRLVIQVSLKGAEPMKYRIEERDSFKVVGIKREFSYANGENLSGITKLWQDVNADGTNELLFSLNSSPSKRVLGVCVNDSDQEAKQVMDYWVAAEYDGEVPEGLSSLEIPSSQWVIFEVNGPMPDAIQTVWKQIFAEWFPSSGYKQAGHIEIESYPDDNPYAADYYSEIWIPVK